MTTPVPVLKSAPLPIVWTIAASDSGGGAGIQADIKTFFDLGVHGCSVVTAITAQNSRGVHEIQATSTALLSSQLRVLAEDLSPAAIKIGVLPCVESVLTLIGFLKNNPRSFVVFDTVLAPTSGHRFANQETIASLVKLLPYINLVTPNIPEAEALTGITIIDTDTQIEAAKKLLSFGASAVLIKGGHTRDDHCRDYFLSHEHAFWLTQKKQSTPHSHGTGCVLSSAIAAFIAQGKPLIDAVVLANAYISKGLHLACAFNVSGSKRGAVAQTGWPENLQHFPQISLHPEAINCLPMPVCDTSRLGLYPVVDSLSWLEKLLQLGVKTLQLRVKNIPDDELNVMVEKAAALGRQYQARLFINDYWQLAIKHNAYGVHLGQEDMADADIDAIRIAGLHLGISTHGEYEFAYAATFKPSYLAIGAIFPTLTKEVIEVGIDNLYRWATILQGHYPLVAIGGIHIHNIDSVLRSGVGSIAVVSAITQADDYQSAVEKLTAIIS